VKESSQFNVFHQFAGCFMPHGLLSIRKLSAGAKVCYAALAQQANARGMTQLNLPLLASSIGESEANVVRYLIELEEAGLIESSRGNVNKEDVRFSFPRHPWQAIRSESERAQPASSLDRLFNESQPQLFAVESPLTQAMEGQAATNKKSSPSSKSRRRKRWFGRPRSCHSLETCLRFITYQKEVLGRRGIYDPVGLAESIYHTGQQDEEVSDWVAEQEANAA
jgi:predicted transcriptional regulator